MVRKLKDLRQFLIDFVKKDHPTEIHGLKLAELIAERFGTSKYVQNAVLKELLDFHFILETPSLYIYQINNDLLLSKEEKEMKNEKKINDITGDSDDLQ